MPNLDKFRQDHYDATAKVSENTRTLAISAIAIVWLFKKGDGGVYEVPEALLYPLLLVVLAMSLDFCQYVYRSIIWHIIFRKKEKELHDGAITEQTELYVHSYINFLGYAFFYAKIICLVFAYWTLLTYFLNTVKWT